MPRMQKKRGSVFNRLLDKVRARNEKQGWYSLFLYDAATERSATYQFNGISYAEAVEAAKDAYRAEYDDGSEYLMIVCVEI